jgi:porin-like protein
MNLGLKTGLLGTAAALALTVASVPAYAQDDLSALRQQLETMKERLAKLEADKADKRRVAAAAAVEAGDKPRSWKLPGTNTSMNIGGFVKMSVLWDFGNSGQTSGTTTTEGIGAGFHAVDGSVADNTFNGGNFQFTARRSRIWFQTWTPTDWGELRTYIEADFAGSGAAAGPSTNVLRLRQAYGTLGPVLIGKTQTLFGGLIGLPELLHDGAPMALGALRIEQIRYSHNFGGGLVLSVALESPHSTSDAAPNDFRGATCVGGVCAPLAAAGFNNTAGFEGPARWPDVVAALQWNFPNGALYGSGMIGQRFIDTAGGATVPNSNNRNDSDIIWGAALGGRYDFGRVEVGFNGGVGRGIGNKYFDGGATGLQNGVIVVSNAADNNVSLKGALVYGALGYVQVKLTDTIRATAAYNWTQNNMADEVPGYYGSPAANSKSVLTGAVNYYWAAFGNLLWNPVPQVTLGAEYGYQYAARYNSLDTHVHRLQLAAIYRF